MYYMSFQLKAIHRTSTLSTELQYIYAGPSGHPLALIHSNPLPCVKVGAPNAYWTKCDFINLLLKS